MGPEKCQQEYAINCQRFVHFSFIDSATMMQFVTPNRPSLEKVMKNAFFSMASYHLFIIWQNRIETNR
jgi:hypothetical protein